MKTVIIDLGCSNLKSLINALDYIECDYLVSSNAEVILNADRLILPGVGAFGAAMKRIDDLSIRNTILSAVNDAKTPILGICLGMQLLSQAGYENGFHEGLKFLNGDTRLMAPGSLRYKVPNYGWHSLRITKKGSFLFQGISESDTFYFVHSYHYIGENISTTFSYGQNFAASVESDNIYGVQFHPEKSRSAGIRVLKNFIGI